MKILYEKMEMEIIVFDSVEIIAASGDAENNEADNLNGEGI